MLNSIGYLAFGYTKNLLHFFFFFKVQLLKANALAFKIIIFTMVFKDLFWEAKARDFHFTFSVVWPFSGQSASALSLTRHISNRDHSGTHSKWLL